MRFIEPKAAVYYLLQTGNRDVLAKVDPERRDELNMELQIAKRKIQQQAQQTRQNPQSEYERLVKSHERRTQKPQDNPLMRGVTPWPQGSSYYDVCGIQVRYVPLKNGSQD